jgi:hypothetical protein
MQSKLLTSDHPAARGRKPQPGESEYQLSFTLEDGSIMSVAMGKRGFDTVTDLLMDMLIDAPSHDDGSLKPKPLTARENLLEWRKVVLPNGIHQLLGYPRGWLQMSLFIIELEPVDLTYGRLWGAMVPDDHELFAKGLRHHIDQMEIAENYYAAFFDRAPKP